MQEIQDIIIVGGGPAGLSAALTARNRGKSVIIITNSFKGSPLAKASHVNNFPGFPDSTGLGLLERMTSHARDAGIAFINGRAISAAPAPDGFMVSVGRDFYQGRALIIAVGTSPGAVFKGERELLGRGVSYCATCDGILYRGKRVAVVGLSQDAGHETQFLRDIGCGIEYFDRKSSVGLEIIGNERVQAVKTADGRIDVDGVFIFRDSIAPDTFISGIGQEKGLVKTDAQMRTNIPGVFAAGDCAGKPYQIAKAVGDGNIAALSASDYITRER